jgi:hypothetical protein
VADAPASASGCGDVQTATTIISDGELDAVPALHVACRLVDPLRRTAVEIRLYGDTLRWLTMHEREPEGAFAKPRGELFGESGFIFPDFVLVQADELPTRTVVFGMNSLSTAATRLPDDHAFDAVVRTWSRNCAPTGVVVSTSVVNERLPAYAPELNPVEYPWANLKGRGAGQSANHHPGRGRRRHRTGHPTGLQERRSGGRILAHTGLSLDT